MRAALRLLALVLTVFGFVGQAHGQPNTCRLTGSACIESGNKTLANGRVEFRPCWNYRDTYECIDPSATNFCAGLQAWPTCELFSTTCTATAFNGSCLTETKVYDCNTRFTGTMAGVVDLGSSYTIASETKNTSACNTPAANPSCYVMGPDVCVDGPGSKTINGFSVFQDCWQWTRPYACVTPVFENYCAPLQALGCTSNGFVDCAEYGPPSNTCNVARNAYTCSNNPNVPGPSISNLGTNYTITRDAIDLTPCESPANNPACSYGGQICIEGPETRNINGLDVYKSCWRWERNYVCASAAPMDYCQPIRGAGCSQQSRTCTQTGPDGQCNLYSTTFACTNSPDVTGTNIVNLDTSYTIVTDQINPSACADPAANPKCTLAQEVCAEGAATRNINGLDVFKTCWRWDRTYTCTTEGLANFCSPLEVTAGCSQVTSACVQYGTQGECIASERSYRCDNRAGEPLPPNVTYLNNEYTITRDEVVSQCLDNDNNPGCQKTGEVCVEAGGTRNINGLDVTKPCWRWEATYTCADPGNATNDCASLETNVDCTLARTSCAVDMYTGVQDCGITTRVYSCRVKPPETRSIDKCYNEACVGGICRGPEDDPDGDFAEAITALELQRQAAGYMDESGRIFRGVPDNCEHRLFGVSNCCKEKISGAQDTSNAAVFAAPAEFAFESVKNYGSAYVWDGLFGTATNAYPEFASMAGGVMGKAYAQQAADFSSFSFYGMSFSVTTIPGAAGAFPSFATSFAFDPVSFGIQVGIAVLTQLAQCNQGEQQLALKRGQRLCTYVGTYKKGKIFRRKYEGFCCYNSRLARIVQEQGRQQLGRQYGAPQNPDCSGFTPADLELLDFSAMDLSEFVADVQAKAMDTTAALNRLNLRRSELIGSAATNKNDAIAQYMPPTPGSTGAVDLEPGNTGSTTPGLPPRTSTQMRGCEPPLALDDKTGACKDALDRYYFPYGGGPMPCATGLVKDADVAACVDPNTGQYYPLNSTVAMPCAPGQYFRTPENVCREPTAP
jgi:conjugal transfer mating pair stabilization protein TraN